MKNDDDATVASGPSARAADTILELEESELRGSPTVIVPASDPIKERYDERYQVRHLLGKGGMGEVHLCLDAKIGREVAVKVMRPKRAEDKRARERFLREGTVQAQLEHPGVLPVYDLGITPNGAPYMAMKRVKGTTLEAVLRLLRGGNAEKAERYSRMALLLLMERVCETMAYAHARGVVHRDLKPANVMLGDFGEVNVLDWGVAKLDSDSDLETHELRAEQEFTVPGSIIGTVAYMAPEQATGDPVTAASDVYALGAMLYEVMTLHRLHTATTVDDRIAASLRGVDARPSSRVAEVEPELDEICVRATAVLRTERYADAGELLAHLRRFLDGHRADELRREIADRHAQAARTVLETASSETVRVTALRDLSAAAVLDPGNPEMIHMIETLLEPSGSVPREVEQELAMANRRRASVATGRSALVYAAGLLILPMLAWMGIRDWTTFAVIIGGVVASAIAAGLMWKTGRAAGNIVWIAAPFAFALVASLDAVISSLLLVPPFVVAMLVAFIINVRPSRPLRAYLLVCGLIAILGPAFASLFGITPPSLRFTDGVIEILPRLAHFPAIPTIALLSITSSFLIIAATLLTGRAVDSLSAAERRLAAQAHRLRALMPRADATAA